jgi:hypothetical protein
MRRDHGERCPGCARRRAGRGTGHRGVGLCWACEGLSAPVRAVPPVERTDVLTYTLAACARQRMPFGPAWRLAVVAALTGLDRDQQRDLLAAFQARRDRLADWYAANAEAPAGPESGGREVLRVT